MSVSALGGSSPPPYGGTVTTSNAQVMTNLRALPALRATTGAPGGQQPPGLDTIQAPVGSHKPAELVASTKPQAPPTFKPMDDRTPVVQRPYAGPVFYTKAGAFSQPVQTLGHGAMVDITA